MVTEHRWVALALALALVGARAGAQPADEGARRAEARGHFERGLRAFNAGDGAAALAEFRRAQELSPHVQVLYNIALVYASSGRAVEAVDACDALLKAPAGLSAEQLARVQAVRAEQGVRVGMLTIEANVPSGAIEVDGVQAGSYPLAAPLRLTVGSHVVGLVATGHAPLRREVLIAGGATAQVRLDLVPLQVRLAHLTLKTRTLAAEVRIDGQLVGRTPLPASLAIAPGAHTLELRRRGYRAVSRPLDLGEGASGEIELELEEDPSVASGSLRLTIDHPDAQVSIDGRIRTGWGQSLALPPGPHRLRVERGGYHPVERTFEVTEGTPTELRVDLDPTADTIAAYTDKARFWRKVAWGSIAGGSALALAAGGYTIYSAGKQGDAQDRFDAFTATLNPGAIKTGQTICVIGGEPFNDQDICGERYDELDKQRSTWKTRTYLGLAGVGVGVAVATTGLILRLTGDDPQRYERGRSESPYGRGPSWRLWAGPGSAGLSGTF